MEDHGFWCTTKDLEEPSSPPSSAGELSFQRRCVRWCGDWYAIQEGNTGSGSGAASQDWLYEANANAGGGGQVAGDPPSTTPSPRPTAAAPQSFIAGPRPALSENAMGSPGFPSLVAHRMLDPTWNSKRDLPTLPAGTPSFPDRDSHDPFFQQFHPQQSSSLLYVHPAHAEPAPVAPLVATFRNLVLGLYNDREPRFICPFFSCKGTKNMLGLVTDMSRGNS